MAFKSFPVLLYAWGLCAALAQDGPSRPAFEVASVKPAAPVTELQNAPPALLERIRESRYSSHPPGWLQMDKARVTLHDLSLLEVVASAYRVRTTQVSGPAWMSELRFDIDAKIPDGASNGSANEMLQSLLEERFGLQLHREDKELPGYALLVGKSGPKLKLADPVAAADTPAEPADPQEMKKRTEERMKNLRATMQANAAAGMPGENTRWWGKNDATLAEVADQLSRIIQKPVVDLTSLEGKYNVQLNLRWSGDAGPESGASQAVAELGLKLEARKIPTTIFAVDKISKTPTEN